MHTPLWHWPAFIALSSFAGLFYPMLLAGAAVIGWVWGESILANLLFCAGIVGVAKLATRVTRTWLRFVLVALATWLVYTVSWWLVTTGPRYELEGAGFSWTMYFGWPGILATATAVTIWAGKRPTPLSARSAAAARMVHDAESEAARE